MSKAIHKLSDLKVRKLKPKEKSYEISDGDRLSIQVRADGSKLWIFTFISLTTKKRKKASFGLYPKSSLAFAREKAAEYRKLITQNIDPNELYQDIKNAKRLEARATFSKVLEEWLSLQKPRLAKSTFEKKANQMRKDFKPLSSIPIAQIHHSQIASIIKIKAISTAETANRYLGYLNNLWAFACTHGYAENNIIVNLHKQSLIPKVEVKNYAKITDPYILQELIEFIYNYKGGLVVRNALKFLLFLPLRSQNLLNLKWENIDLKKRTLTIPRSQMKVKNKNLLDFKMYLVDEVITLLEELKIYNEHSEYIFSKNNIKIRNESLIRALERGGFNNETLGRRQRPHSFRGTFLSLAESYSDKHDFSSEIADLILDHQI